MNAQTEIEPMATRVALHPFLAGMNRKQLAWLTDCAMVVQFKKGQVIFREGDIANRFYLIETGKVILESSGTLGDPVVIDKIGAVICSAGRGCFRRTCGISSPARSSR